MAIYLPHYIYAYIASINKPMFIFAPKTWIHWACTIIHISFWEYAERSRGIACLLSHSVACHHCWHWYWGGEWGVPTASVNWECSFCRPCFCSNHDDVLKWKHFPHYWAFVRWIHWSPVNSSRHWRGVLFSFKCAWINGCETNRKAGDLRRHRADYDVTVMSL